LLFFYSQKTSVIVFNWDEEDSGEEVQNAIIPLKSIKYILQDPHFFPATHWVSKWETAEDESEDTIFQNNAFAEYRFVASMFRNFHRNEGHRRSGYKKRKF
jgi:hypothetical protein